jgi:SAM-dependent methyltransferase
MDFDRFAEAYEQEVAAAIAFAGIPHGHFLEFKVNHILEKLRQRFGELARLRVLDVGCGIGLADQLLQAHLPKLKGVDVSEKSLRAARIRNPRVAYHQLKDGRLPFENAAFDVVLAICVWHHVPSAQWTQFLAEILRVTDPEGILLVYEHNPWNPLTRLAVSRCAFDSDAVLLPATEAARNLRLAGFGNVVVDHLFFLPTRSRFLQLCERTILRGVPLGAQYALCATRK